MRLTILVMLFLLVGVSAETAHVKLAAVTSEGEGAISDLTVEIREGAGRVLITTTPLIGVNTQHSENTATLVAQAVTKTNLSDKDVIFTIVSDTGVVDGPSAGGVMTVAVIAAITNRTPREDVIMTGTIDEFGRIGAVGGIFEKAQAAADYLKGYKNPLFLIPKGQRVQTQYTKTVETPAPGTYIESVTPVQVDVVDYAKKNWGLDVVEVADINSAASLFFSNFSGETIVQPSPNLEVPETLVMQAELALKVIADGEINRATVADKNERFTEVIVIAAELRDKGYYYSAANLAFLTSISAKSQYYTLADARAEFAQLLGEIDVATLNSTSYREDDLEILAAAQQRYLWALSVNNSTDVPQTLAGVEWLAATKDILSGVRGTGKLIDSAAIAFKADASLAKARDFVESADALNADTAEARRALDNAYTARENGFVLAQLFNSIDTAAYARSAQIVGSLDSLIQKAGSLQANLTTGWSITYMKHSQYLTILAKNSASAENARSAIFLAYRGLEVESAFGGLPNYVPQLKLPDVSGFSGRELALALLVLYLLKRDFDLKNQLRHIIGRQEVLLLKLDELKKPRRKGY